MSRIRTIKPTFWTSEQVVECSLSARLLFIGLWNFCDGSGRHSFSPKQIKSQVFPSDDISVDVIIDMLWELSDNGLIVIYENKNSKLLEVTGWSHQKIDHEHSSRLPGSLDEHSEIIRLRVIDASLKDLGLRTKDLGKEKKQTKKRNSDTDQFLLEFEKVFWPASPHKVGKAAALKAFVAARKRCELEPLMAGMAAYVRDKPADRPWCNPATWLNQDRWLDQPARAGPNSHDQSPPTPEQNWGKWLAESWPIRLEELEKYGKSVLEIERDKLARMKSFGVSNG